MSNNQLLPRGQYETAGFDNQVGREKCFEDVDWSSKVQTRRSEHAVRCRLVKNSSGFALLPAFGVLFKDGTNRTEVAGYSHTTAADGKSVVIVDEYLPAAGVPDGAYFWVVVEGPSEVMTDLAGGANNLVPEDTVLVALTAATSGATTAGRVAPQDLTGATAPLGNQINGAFGRAMSAKTTAETNERLLAFISNRWD